MINSSVGKRSITPLDYSHQGTELYQPELFCPGGCLGLFPTKLRSKGNDSFVLYAVVEAALCSLDRAIKAAAGGTHDLDTIYVNMFCPPKPAG